MKSGSDPELVWTMVPRTKAVALAVLILPLIISCVLLTQVEHKDPASGAGIAQAWYTVDVNVTVTDEVGRPMGGALVGSRNNTSDTWTTGPEGYVVILGLADNETYYTLWANKSGYLNSLDVDVYVTPNQTTNVTLVITGGTIYGIVTSPSGPILDATVSLPPPLSYVANVSSTDGTYSLEGVQGGLYSYVVASAIGYDPNISLNITVTAGKTTRLDFTIYSQFGWISGYVFHAATRAPLNDTNVSVSLGDITITATSQIDGSYNIYNLTEGNYVVTATMDGFYSNILSGIVVDRGNGTFNVNFTLVEKPTRIFGTVKSGTFLQPEANVSVVGTTYFNLTNVEGDYSIENLTAGTYTISAQLEGYAIASVSNVVLPVGGEIRVDIELVALPGAIVRGEVLAKDSGAPLMYASVTIVGPEGKERFRYTNSKGQFEFTGLTEGNYTLQFTMKGYRPLEVGKIEANADTVSNDTYYLEPQRKGFEGFVFGFDLAHSMMILALFITIVILAVAVYLRYRTFQTPDTAPAIYDQEEEPAEKKDDLGTGESRKEQDEKDEI